MGHYEGPYFHEGHPSSPLQNLPTSEGPDTVRNVCL